MTIRSLPASPATWTHTFSNSPRRGLLLALLTSIFVLATTACGTSNYQFPEYNFAGRPVPPSKLSNRVMVGYTTGNSGVLQILDAQRDIRNNVYNANSTFSISGYSGNNPNLILSFPDELRGYVYSNAPSYPLTIINYGTESATGAAVTFSSPSNSVTTASDFGRILSAQEETGQLIVADAKLGTFALNLPNVYQVAMNPGDTILLAMVRNSNSLYRVIRVNENGPTPPGAVDCEPTILPVYCVIPVPGTFDRPVAVDFAVDGSNAYVVSCGVECGGGSNGGAGISLIPEAALQFNNAPTSFPYPAVVSTTVPIPGGATDAISDGTNLYIAGQQLQPDGLFEGFLTTMPLNTLVPGTPTPISDGYHSKLLFADNNTLWIGSQACSNGERAKLGLNYNCLTRYDLTEQTAAVVPALLPATATTPATVPYPNSSENPLYLGSLTGICWVQGLNKVYTAYGGQIHAFKTADGSEIDNYYITVQGTALDVAYMDANTDEAN